MRRATVAAAVAVIVLSVVGCGSGPAADRTGPEVTLTTAPRIASTPTDPARPATPAPAPPPLDGEGGAGEDPDSASAVAPDKASVRQARDRARAFMRAFARTDLPQEQWWAGVAGYFTPAAAAIYRNVDVANVPVHRVNERIVKLVKGSTRYRAVVTVGTDIGAYTVTLVRAAGDWLVERTTPPDDSTP